MCIIDKYDNNTLIFNVRFYIGQLFKLMIVFYKIANDNAVLYERLCSTLYPYSKIKTVNVQCIVCVI